MALLELGLQLIANSVQDAAEKRMLDRWRKEYSDYAARRDRQKKILSALAEGYDTIFEISAATGISYASVRRVLGDLTDRGRIQKGEVITTNKIKGFHREFRFELTTCEA